MSAYQYQIKNFPLDNDALLLQETLFHNANGYIGVRGNLEEGYPEGYRSIRGQYINGFYNNVDMPQAEKLYGLIEEKQTMVNVADTQSVRVYANGQEISMLDSRAGERARILDMESGVTERSFLYNDSDQKLRISITRMTSMEILPLFLIRYEVASENCSASLRFESLAKGDVMNFFDPSDPRVAGEACRHIVVKSAEHRDGITFITSETTKSGLQVTTAVKNVLSGESFRETIPEETQVTEKITADLALGETVTFYKYAVFCDSRRYENTLESAEKIMKEVCALSPEVLYEQQKRYMKNFWESCAVDVQGDEDLNAALHYNLYQLIQSAGKDPRSNIAAKGLSGEGYEGHYFWDTEMYMQPFFTLTSREVAGNLIRYRYTILDQAKENARLLGHKKGAAYPWRTIMGKECSGFFPAGSAQYHISGDIAYSVAAYYLATKDLAMLEECGEEILIETARLWMDIGNYYEGKFRINTVTGPDEYTCLVNNNYYTNSVAKYNLYWAEKAYRLLENAGLQQRVIEKTGVTEEELQEFARASADMYLPYDEKLGINPQDDSFLQKAVWDISTITEEEKPILLHYHPMYIYRYQICKQADTVLAYFVLEDYQDEETMRRSFEYYEKVTTHDSSLSSCIFSIMASRLGFEDKALAYFGESAKMDLFNTHKNTKDGIHTANMGGTYMAVVYGFGGLRIKESGLSLAPHLPKTWEGYRFRILYEDSRMEIQVDRKQCRVKLMEGTEKKIRIYGEEYVLKDILTVEFENREIPA